MTSSVQSLDQLSETDALNVGGKAANLAKLIQSGLPVPSGFVISLSAFDNSKLNHEAKEQIKKLTTNDKLYAIRSSALAEDAEGASWAGQFETFLNTKPEDVLNKIEECHGSAKKRARAYATDKDIDNFNVGVVVQEMLEPEYAGVLFTKDPVTSKDQLITEYITGLGEDLVSGKVDPKQVVLNSEDANQAPFDTSQLAELAIKVERLFGTPQDIEWAWVDNKIWLVQARPITATQEDRQGYHLGEPNDLFYWGPSRAKPMFMSDFMAAAERIFVEMSNNPQLPNPPNTLVLFDEGKMVWLSNTQDFVDFTEKTFEAYEKLNRLDQDIANWKAAAGKLALLSGEKLAKTLIEAWYNTEFAEFSLYGAETALIKKLSRFDADTRQEVWGAFTVPDKPTFLARIDAELSVIKDVDAISKQYPWIQDGYNGVAGSTNRYFEERLKIIENTNPDEQIDIQEKRNELTERLKLTDDEVTSLTLARKLAEFMDDRKAWMMQTRRLITQNIGNIENGWFFSNGKVSLIDQENTHELWQRYIDFKASTNAVIGIVASNGGKHFLNGEVAVVSSPTDVIANDKIVVVPSTSPSYVPLMRKARALVTDHGGMMSHAAIVAREFNLPCIVGTKQATKVLSNDDKVVLDLVKGEVIK